MNEYSANYAYRVQRNQVGGPSHWIDTNSAAHILKYSGELLNSRRNESFRRASSAAVGQIHASARSGQFPIDAIRRLMRLTKMKSKPVPRAAIAIHGTPGAAKTMGTHLCCHRRLIRALHLPIRRMPTHEVANILPVQHRTADLEQGIRAILAPAHVTIEFHSLPEYVVDIRLGTGARDRSHLGTATLVVNEQVGTARQISNRPSQQILGPNPVRSRAHVHLALSGLGPGLMPQNVRSSHRPEFSWAIAEKAQRVGLANCGMDSIRTGAFIHQRKLKSDSEFAEISIDPHSKQAMGQAIQKTA